VKHYYFRSRSEPLLASYHRPERLHPRSTAVLLCNPFGEEANRAHRIYRVLATQLARSGYPVLRFDYSGTGDSMGDDAEASLDDWLDDIAHAGGELRKVSGARRLVALGMRLGGSLATLAAARRGLKLRHLLLWDPVVDGAGYLRDLASLHREYMRDEMGTAGWDDRLRLDADGFPDEALGSVLHPALKIGIGAINLGTVELAADVTTVVVTGTSPSLAALEARVRRSPASHWIEMATSVPWSSEAAMNAAVVPMDVVRTLIGRIEEVSP
jgi:pimeloyl-ACP methyl ester carboxylesterase